MSPRILVELSGDRKLLIGGIGTETGLTPVGLGDDVAKVAAEKFQGALASLKDLVAILDSSVGKLAKRPNKVEMEFGASLTGECDLWIVSGEGTAEFKVTLTWE